MARARKLAEAVAHRFVGPAGALRCRRCGGVLMDGEQPREGRWYCSPECWELTTIDAEDRIRDPEWAWRYEVLMHERWIPGVDAFGRSSKWRPKMVSVWQGEAFERAMVEARARAYGFSRPVVVELWDRSLPGPEGGYKGRRKGQRGLLVWDEVAS